MTNVLRMCVSGDVSGDVSSVVEVFRQSQRAWSSPCGSCSRHAQLAPEAARRLRTACLGEELYDGTYTILVTRAWPRGLPERAVGAWWPLLAPSLRLLHAPGVIPRESAVTDGAVALAPRMSPRMLWPAFVWGYRAELDRLPIGTQHTTIVRLGWLLHRYPTVTLLSCEAARGRPECEVRSQRRVLYDWLLS